MLKSCMVCGKEFNGHGLATLCSPACRRVRKSEHNSAWRAKNPVRKAEYQRAWKQANKEKRRERYRTDPVLRLTENVRRCIHKSLCTQSASKSRKSFDYLGCTGAEFAEYLAHHYAWKPDFTLENYGTVWHVDHIRPLASFDLTNEEEQKAAFHYTNCQPMRASDNMSKGSLWEGERHNHGRD